jgi:hypothetical protein
MKSKGMNRKNFIKFYSSWFSSQRYETMVTENIETLLPLFETLTPENRIKQAIPLMETGVYFSALGSYTCIENPLLGWETIKKAILYRYWEHRICYRYWQKPERKKKGAYDVSANVPSLIALSNVIMPMEGTWLAKLFCSSMYDGCLYWDGRTDEFPHFVYWLLNIKYNFSNHATNIQHLRYPYDEIANNWNDPDNLAKAIRCLCDHHLTSNDPRFDDECVDFDDHLSIINPVEIHLLEHVRHSLNLDILPISHEILQPPFYPIPDFVQQISNEKIISEDKILQQVIALNKDWCDCPED